MVQEVKEGGPTKAQRDSAWEAGFQDATNDRPLRDDWPEAETAGDYYAGHRDGRDAVAMNEPDTAGAEADEDREAEIEAESAENDEADEMAHLRGVFATFKRKAGRRCGEIAERVGGDIGEAALDIAEDLEALFGALVEAIDRDEGPEAVAAVRDTLRQVDPINAAKVATLIPPGREATRRGLAQQIGKGRALLAFMDRDLRKTTPPAFLDHCGRDLWDVHKNAETLTGADARGVRKTRRELDALVHAWDVLED